MQCRISPRAYSTLDQGSVFIVPIETNRKVLQTLWFSPQGFLWAQLGLCDVLHMSLFPICLLTGSDIVMRARSLESRLFPLYILSNTGYLWFLFCKCVCVDMCVRVQRPERDIRCLLGHSPPHSLGTGSWALSQQAPMILLSRPHRPVLGFQNLL